MFVLLPSSWRSLRLCHGNNALGDVTARRRTGWTAPRARSCQGTKGLLAGASGATLLSRWAGLRSRVSDRRCNRSRRQRRLSFQSLVRRAQLMETEIRAAMQLEPSRLRVEPAEETARRSSTEGDDLRGGWLPLFRGSAPYVAMNRQSAMVFHIPGHLLDSERSAELANLTSDIVLCTLLGVRPVLVLALEHRVLARLKSELALPESGKSANALEAICEIAARSPADMAQVLRVLKQEAGLVCAEVESLFCQAAARPGMSDGFSVPACQVFSSSQLLSTSPRRAPTGEKMSPLLGQVHDLDVTQIKRRLADGEVVCLLPLGRAGSSDLHVVPSEELAAEAAKDLKASKLIFFTRGQKIVDSERGNVIPTLQLRDASRFTEHAQAHSELYADEESREMIRYLELLTQALRNGTRRGHLIDPRQGALLQELYTTDGSGTMISLDLYDGIRLAHSGDVSGILKLIEPLVEKGLLRRRSTYEVENACNNREMFVWKRDDETIGCASLQRFEDSPDQAELGCFVISTKCRGKGHGAVLLSYVEQVALLSGLRSLFLLTTQTMQWFVERGFNSAPLETLPPSKQHGYDMGRSSKVFVKDISVLPSELQQRFTFVEVDTLD
eukprot:TRINITY_DN38264_c0_g1_i1.p1 TRINITY_DN38264_c0_g1~~TRINITY_DN38264_c0_g1_i1.p1  ORF type:complete len:614 (-),score=112.84 TRINITY_DN38264_c0_g1_i1:32-1873(-)